LFATEWRPPLEQPDDEYPLVLSTVREVGHYSARTMSGNCATLQVLADEPGYVQISVPDAERLGIQDQELIWIASRRGKVMSRAAVSDRINVGVVYMTYHWWVGSCNELTIDHLDAVSKTPEYKYCAVKVEKIDDQNWTEGYVQEQYSQLRAQMAVGSRQ
jgi:formate dehydrogenase major subunit